MTTFNEFMEAGAEFKARVRFELTSDSADRLAELCRARQNAYMHHWTTLERAKAAVILLECIDLFRKEAVEDFSVVPS